jgi:signal transduction histidine kinase
LKTPLTQLQLELEHGLSHSDGDLRASAESALETIEQLSGTIDDVLTIARQDAADEGFDAAALVEQCQRQWQGLLRTADRSLVVEADPSLTVRASLPAARQIMHVLLDNAVRHGDGTVTMSARRSHGAVAFDVVDEGEQEPVSLQAGSGLGLTLAHELAQSQGGRLLVDRSFRHTRFTLLLPGSADEWD